MHYHDPAFIGDPAGGWCAQDHNRPLPPGPPPVDPEPDEADAWVAEADRWDDYYVDDLDGEVAERPFVGEEATDG